MRLRSESLRGWGRVVLVGVKTVHTAAFFSIGSCLVYLGWSAVVRKSDRHAAIAGAVVTAEALVYAANGFRCPLTDVAEHLGSEHGSVADIYLPRWLESHLPLFTGPIFAGAVALHARNVMAMRTRDEDQSSQLWLRSVGRSSAVTRSRNTTTLRLRPDLGQRIE